MWRVDGKENRDPPNTIYMMRSHRGPKNYNRGKVSESRILRALIVAGTCRYPQTKMRLPPAHEPSEQPPSLGNLPETTYTRPTLTTPSLKAGIAVHCGTKRIHSQFGAFPSLLLAVRIARGQNRQA